MPAANKNRLHPCHKYLHWQSHYRKTRNVLSILVSSMNIYIYIYVASIISVESAFYLYRMSLSIRWHCLTVLLYSFTHVQWQLPQQLSAILTVLSSVGLAHHPQGMWESLSPSVIFHGRSLHCQHSVFLEYTILSHTDFITERPIEEKKNHA